MTYTYAQFKAVAPRFIMAALGPVFLEALYVMNSYGAFRKAIIALNDVEPGCFVKAARPYARVCSPGERELLKASASSPIHARCRRDRRRRGLRQHDPLRRAVPRGAMRGSDVS